METCAAKGFNVGVSVVDSAGVLKVLLARDGTSPRGVQSSTNKAVTALTFGEATSHLGERARTEPALAERIAANPNLNARAGGVLLTADGGRLSAWDVETGRAAFEVEGSFARFLMAPDAQWVMAMTPGT